ncbi:Flavoredoxin [compost metagenome]
MKKYKKKDFPVWEIRQLLEPGPIVLVSSFYKGKTNIMTMGWHTVMEFTPSLIGCIISNQNYSFSMIKKSKECVINIPTLNIANKTVRIGNCTGKDLDKFERFDLTPRPADLVQAPLIEECYANLECKLVDTKLVSKYNFFVFKVVKAHKATAPKYPKTIHYMGHSAFMTAGKVIRIPSKNA